METVYQAWWAEETQVRGALEELEEDAAIAPLETYSDSDHLYITTRPPGKLELSVHEPLPEGKENATTTSLLSILPDDVITRGLGEGPFQLVRDREEVVGLRAVVAAWMERPADVQPVGLSSQLMDRNGQARGGL
ncbi:hypothetical protein E2C01_038701 [Portunus trituberculatus]|uniref:Uncharacterized protein n=1 Tax=Portunus trituberculatus TaxID=210409 RepID=A0A5B7FJ84_PORTR|nr:hypothetical protein [Portunus trituberculatus]